MKKTWIKLKPGSKYIFSISHMTINTHIHANIPVYTSKVTCMWQIKSINGGCVALMTDLSSALIKCYDMSLPRWDCSVCTVWTEMSSGFLSESKKNYGSLMVTWSCCNELEQLVACLECAYRASDLLTDEQLNGCVLEGKFHVSQHRGDKRHASSNLE